MKKPALLLAALAILAGCQGNVTHHPMFEPSHYQVSSSYTTFDEYLQETEKQIRATRFFQSKDIDVEVRANMPFELKPQVELPTTRGILLVHGLADSPFSFVDVGKRLSEQGYLVRTILLEGHGTRPGDMITADHSNWEKLVARHVEMLKGEVDEVYLGGFSTGGNLTYLHAIDDPAIKGLMLFSPGFQSDEPNAKYAPLAAFFVDWLYDVKPEQEFVYTRYMNTAAKGFGEYYKTSAASMKRLTNETFDRPTFMVLTEHDSVLEVELIRDLFRSQFTHPNNRLVWFGSQESGLSGATRTIHSRVPELRINSMSHMGMLFSPDNPYYGINGPGRICRNGQQAEGAFEYCFNGGEVWYGAYGTEEPNQVVARLTFNPEFELMMEDLNTVFPTAQNPQTNTP
ncbi:alpha/beta hydrolase [Parendozoicomonas haliclonae]|uniref:Thermostable monoacylglycerol lipase n=1 Tax=Parendozoicomonas haliclonae TaxID=1960125 RepID=A0A1X7AR83_9GAMM|nr:alpha/beta fold hydrolase [Parendozoicomonas haliclonae]SMA49917.1 Thermostable monoacylglycerol lipase [Parendozoicomonas haliclonae]